MKPIRSPDLVERQRQRCREGIARIMRERSFENVNQLKNHLLAKGHRISPGTLDPLMRGKHGPSTQVLQALWSTFGIEEFNPATFGPTWDVPWAKGTYHDSRVPEQQNEVVQAVVRDFMRKRGLTTSSALHRISGLSQSSCQALMRGDPVGWGTVEKLRRITQDDRLAPENFEKVQPVTPTGPDATAGGPPDDDARVGEGQERVKPDRTNVAREVFEDFRTREGIRTVKEALRRIGIGGSGYDSVKKGRPSPRTLERLYQATGDERVNSATFVFPDLKAQHGEIPRGPSQEETAPLPYRGEDRRQGEEGGAQRFFITAQSFRPIRVVPTEEEIVDTKVLIRELYRRLAIFSMVADERVREQLQRILGPEIDEFYLVLQIFEAEIPTAVAKIMDAQRLGFRALDLVRQPTRKKGR